MNRQPPPFIKQFSTTKHNYVYDVNTNNFYSIDNITSELLRNWEALNKSVFIQDDNIRSNEILIDSAIAKIRYYQRSGIFSPNALKGLKFPYSSKEFKDQLTSNMKQVILNVTERCNLRCSYCPFTCNKSYHRPHSNSDMNFKTAKKAVDLFLSNSHSVTSPCISFYGGEPLLNFKLIRQVIDYIKQTYSERNINFHITTNGTLLKGDILRYLISQNSTIQVSLDGPPNIHDRYRKYSNGNNSHAVIIDNLKNAEKTYPNLICEHGFLFSCTIGSLTDLRSIYNYFKRDNTFFNKHNVSANLENTLNIIPATHRRQIANTSRRLFDDYKSAIFKGRIPHNFLRSLFEPTLLKIHKRSICNLDYYSYPNGICVPGVHRLFCTTDGQLTVCERINSGLIIGDVDNGINEEKAYSIVQEYAKISSSDCKSCWAVRFCSLCFCHLYTDKFDIEEKRNHCRDMRDSMLSEFITYFSIIEENDRAFEYLSEIHNY
jgi:uncharacterized protein